ncbi:hypothetical protein [Paenirhodobacter populi]|uniref:hypothetical protein n=1 Tax=Paenirhodobacter populi TaxID=2306993 RepID=UPI000FE38D64|nr:hypothetical protein [Sinirhodobacter populi]RWR06000.1 hypothetical protein D2T32_14925 [Sinirhodobacter populi]
MPFEFDRKMSLGNLITIGVVLFGAIGAWFTLVAGQQQLTRDLIQIQTEFSTRKVERDRQLDAHESRIRAVEIAQASQSSDLRNIQIGISEIKASIAKLGQP